MSLLLYGEIRPSFDGKARPSSPDAAMHAQECTLPDPLFGFGAALQEHLRGKTNPAVRTASIAAWSLLAEGLGMLGVEALPEVRFEPGGKPCFPKHPLHFSLSHSEGLAAALISDAPCGVDVEHLRPEVAARLRARCLSDAERAQNCDFFEIWTKKECIAKLDGSGMRNHPCEIDTLDACWSHRFYTMRLRDSIGQEYALSALCVDVESLTITKIGVVSKRSKCLGTTLELP